MRKTALSKVMMVLLAIALAIGALLSACAQPSPGAGATQTVTVTAQPSPGAGSTQTVTVTKTQTIMPSPTSQVYRLKYQFIAAPGTDFWKTLMDKIVTPIQEASGGRVKIDAYGSSAVVPDLELHKATGQGVVDLAMTFAGYYAGPLSSLQTAYPGQYDTKDDQRSFLALGFRDILRGGYAKNFGVYFIDEMVDEPADICSKGKIASLKDFKGTKVRAGGAIGQVIAQLGEATVVMIPVTEIYTSVATGVIDAYAWGDIYATKLNKLEELIRYVIDPPLIAARGGTSFLANLKVWNSLPPDIQKIIEYVHYHYTNLYSTFQGEFQAQRWQIKKYFLEKGIQFVSLPKEDYAAIRNWSVKAMDDLAKQDPEFAGRAVDLLKPMMAAR